MKEWNEVKLGDIAEFSNGINFDKNAYAQGVKLIGVSNFGDRFFPPYDELDEVKKEIVRQNDYLEKNDIVFVRSNGNKELVGRCMLIDDISTPLTYSGFCIRCRLKDHDLHNPVFFTYYFKSKLFRRAMSGTAVGANIQNLSQGRLSSHVLKTPDILLQKKIADILFSYEKYIENNKKQIKLLEEVAQRLYKEWFVDLRFPGYEKTNIIDGVPEGWKKEPLGKALQVVRGRSYSSKELSEKEGLLMVNLSNIRPYGGYIRDQEKHYSGKVNENQFVETHDLLMGVTDMTQERRTVGRVAIVPNLHAKAMISMDLIKLIPVKGSPLFYYALLNYGGYSEAISRFANGTNVLHLRPDVLDIIDVVIPDMRLQRRFVEFYEHIQNRLDVLQDEMIIAAEARDRLLPKLMSGEIEL